MPETKDVNKWHRIVKEGQIDTLRPEELVAAIQDLGAQADPNILHPLLKAISEHAMKFLRRSVGTNHPNRGEDIILRAHHSLMEALFKPNSADGKGFRIAYYSRLSFRLKDAISNQLREQRTEEDILASKAVKAIKKAKASETAAPELQHEEEEEEGNEDDLAEREALRGFSHKLDYIDEDDNTSVQSLRRTDLMDGVNTMLEELHVSHLLEQCIPDERKRLAFRLYMDDMPAKSKKTDSISKVLNVDESTIRVWIEEVKAILRNKLGGQHD